MTTYKSLTEQAIAVLNRHIVPDGISDKDALSELYGIFDGPDYRAALAAAPAPVVVQAEVSEWQPIATAPKGECILLYTAEGIVEARWEHRAWEQMPCYATYDGCGGVALSCQPTHWMPLPAAPKVSP